MCVILWVYLEELMTVVDTIRCGFRIVFWVHYMW